MAHPTYALASYVKVTTLTRRVSRPAVLLAHMLVLVLICFGDRGLAVQFDIRAGPSHSAVSQEFFGCLGSFEAPYRAIPDPTHGEEVQSPVRLPVEEAEIGIWGGRRGWNWGAAVPTGGTAHSACACGIKLCAGKWPESKRRRQEWKTKRQAQRGKK